MNDSVEIFVTNGRQCRKMYALEFFQSPVDVVRATVNRHIVSAQGKSRREFFSEGFEAAVIGGDPPRAEDGDTHCQPFAVARLFAVMSRSASTISRTSVSKV